MKDPPEQATPEPVAGLRRQAEALQAFPNRLLVAAATAGPRPARWIRLAETSC